MSVDTGSLQTPQPAPIEEAGAPPQGGVWKVLATLLALIAVPLYVLSEALRLSPKLDVGGGVYFPYLFGTALGTLLLPLLFVLVARLFARPYTKRSFWKAYCIGMLLCAFTATSAFMGAVAEHARGKAEAMPMANSGTEWVTYLSAAGGYSVEMPGTPERAEVSNGAGVKLVTMHAVFSVATFPITDLEQHPLELFALVADEYRASYGAEVQESPVFHAGMIGRELRIKLPNGEDMVTRLYTKHGVFYETAVGGPALDETLASRFLDSFELVTSEG